MASSENINGSDLNIKFECVRSREGSPLNIIAGLWYHFTVKSIPNGLVTFEEENREGHEGHLIQLGLNDLEEFETPDGELQNHALWTITPTYPPSKENDYEFRVLSLPEGKMTYSIGSSWGGRYMELDIRHPENYIHGANMYYSSLWYLRPTEVSECFTLHNSDPRRQPNFVTFSNESSERGQLMQIGTKDLHLYDVKGGSFRNDALWSFQPQLYELKGNVTHFEFDIPADIEDEVYPIRISEEKFSKDQENKIIQCSTDFPESFKLTFLQSFKPFKDDKVSFDVNDIAKKIKELQGKSLNFERKLGSNTVFAASSTTNYCLKETIEMPPDTDEVKVRVYCDVIKDLEIPFRADILVTATAHCAQVLDNGKLSKVDNVAIKDPLVIQHLLKFERFAGKIKEMPKSKIIITKPNVPAKQKLQEEGVVCQVSGRLIISCAKRIFHKVC